MRLSRQFKASLFFLRKDFERTKAQIKPKQTNKNKNKRTKNNKGNNFLLIKTSKRTKIGYFALWCFLYAQNIFVKRKINWLKIVLITSFTLLLACTPINPPFENLFVLTTHIYLYYFYLWSSVRTFFICENLFLFVIICVNLCLYENKQAYECHHLKQIFYHQNTIMIFCWIRYFVVFYFELFSFCV